MSLARRFGGFLMALLRELADENAYRRELRLHGRAASGEEWRRFTEEQYRRRFTRPKCC